jgi:hypothetical protein
MAADEATWGDVIDGTDNNVYKRIITEGSGETPPDGCNVQVHCECPKTS